MSNEVCPNCGCHLDSSEWVIEWCDTDGEPFNKTCPRCQVNILIHVEQSYSYELEVEDAE